MYFPTEILSAILCYQPKIDLKRARLVCKAFDAAAVPFLFDEIFVTVRYADIERSTLLASRFGPFVKTLVFCSEFFEPGVSWVNFERLMGDTALATSYYNSYCRLREEQKELLNEGEFYGHLCSTLRVLSNLQNVIITNDCRAQGLCWCHQAYVDGCTRTFNPWSDDIYPALKSLRPAPKHRCFESINGLDHKRSNAWPEMLRALFTSRNALVKTIITEGGNRDSGLVTSAFCMTPRQRFCAAQVLQNLTSLHLHLDVNFLYDMDLLEDADLTDDVENELFSERVIARTLSAAINLETLVIAAIVNIIDLTEHDYFKMILGGCKMPRLVTFRLSNITITEAGMTAFLQESLEIRHMSLDQVNMISGSWENMLRTIKDTLALESYQSGRIYGGVTVAGFERWKYQTDRSIDSFLFGDGPNPFRKAALEVAAASQLQAHRSMIQGKLQKRKRRSKNAAR